MVFNVIKRHYSQNNVSITGSRYICCELINSPVTSFLKIISEQKDFGANQSRNRKGNTTNGYIQPNNTHLYSSPSPGGSFHSTLAVNNQYVFVYLQDTVIYDRLADSSRYKEITLKHLEQFATEGEWANIAPCLPKVKHLLGCF